MIQYVCIPTIYMKIQYNESIIDLSKTNDILLVVTLDHMKYDKSKNYNDLFLLWENHFKKYNIPIWIISPDYTFEDTYIHYAKNINLFQSVNCLKTKSVFGKNYNIVSTKLILLSHGKIIFEQKRINNKSIKTLYIKAIEEKYKIFIKNLKNSVDIPDNLW